MSLSNRVLNFLFKQIKFSYYQIILLAFITIYFLIAIFGTGLRRGRELQAEEYIKCKGKIVYGFRYTKISGECTFITNSSDEGYYYKTELEAWENGKLSMDSDSLIGYKVYKKSLAIFRTIEDSN